MHPPGGPTDWIPAHGTSFAAPAARVIAVLNEVCPNSPLVLRAIQAVAHPVTAIPCGPARELDAGMERFSDEVEQARARA
jgi:hypothetical protein